MLLQLLCPSFCLISDSSDLFCIKHMGHCTFAIAFNNPACCLLQLARFSWWEVLLPFNDVAARLNDGIQNTWLHSKNYKKITNIFIQGSFYVIQLHVHKLLVHWVNLRYSRNMLLLAHMERKSSNRLEKPLAVHAAGCLMPECYCVDGAIYILLLKCNCFKSFNG